jgi:hypothetical protein
MFESNGTGSGTTTHHLTIVSEFMFAAGSKQLDQFAAWLAENGCADARGSLDRYRALPTEGTFGAGTRYADPTKKTGSNSKARRVKVTTDLYVHLGHDREGALRFISIAGARDREDDLRARLEIICDEASALLRAGTWDMDALVASWQGSHLEPAGWCPELACPVAGPLDAVAKMLKGRVAQNETNT